MLPGPSVSGYSGLSSAQNRFACPRCYLSHRIVSRSVSDVLPKFPDNLVRETAAALLEKPVPVRVEFEACYGAYPVPHRIEKIVNQQCRRIVKR